MRIGRGIAIAALIGIVAVGIVDYSFGTWSEFEVNGTTVHSGRGEETWLGTVPKEKIEFKYRVVHHGLAGMETRSPSFEVYYRPPVSELPREGEAEKVKVFEWSPGAGATLGRWDEKTWRFSFTPENSGRYIVKGRNLTNGILREHFEVAK